MRVSDQFILRTILDDTLLIPSGDAAIHVKGLIALSESAVLLYHKLESGCTEADLVEALLAEYDVSKEEAEQDTKAFLEQMRQLQILIEDET